MKLIVLDRDGVINEDSDEYIKSPEEWVPVPGSVEAIASLTQAGYSVIVFTNQSGLARGLFDITTLHGIHQKMQKTINKAGGRIEAVFFCPHASGDGCNCRKPKPGMLHSIMERLDVELAGVPVVGDSLRDLQAAMAVGAAPVLVLSGKGEKTREANPGLEDHIPVFDNLAAYVDHLLQENAAPKETKTT
ncbi:D-glycero-beta-D-manno-heptose 1,7-bisphosphate 7-phosphatase [Granulosicoccaceae sp. 1_MG-2023]|nr:D-glycero-beta-D-manno-heptose 1,7-bisphosphate 7-phosphatase [Granulosicoccaceae sp. 1_MG-2023]